MSADRKCQKEVAIRQLLGLPSSGHKWIQNFDEDFYSMPASREDSDYAVG